MNALLNQQWRRVKKVRLNRERSQIAKGALKLGWTFKVALLRGQGPGIYSPTQSRHWMQAGTERSMTLREAASLAQSNAWRGTQWQSV